MQANECLNYGQFWGVVARSYTPIVTLISKMRQDAGQIADQDVGQKVGQNSCKISDQVVGQNGSGVNAICKSFCKWR